MPHTFAKIALFAPVLGPALAAIAGCGAVNASNSPNDARALSLNVTETAGSVEIEVVANSQVTQQVEFKAELTGASNSRHTGNTGVAAGDRQVLSRMKVSSGDGWCAKVDVSEATGARYTLTAGDCGLL